MSPLLLLHTWGGDAGTWGPAVRHLGAQVPRLEAVDLPGHGARAAEPFTVDGAVAAGSAALDRLAGAGAGAGAVIGAGTGTGDLAAGPAHVVGSGLGALIALVLAQRRPDRVRSLTLVGFPPADGPEAARRPAETEALLARDGTERFAKAYVDSTVLSGDPAHGDLLYRSMAATRPEVLLDSLRATLGWAGHVRPGPLGPPCQVVRGARDHRVGAASAAALARRLGGSTAVVPGAGHVAYLDEPEAFAATLAAFHHGPALEPGR
ncbi:alpha/beta hydrolase [Streptomyces sp. NBC_01317]|uniref:alpha/beta fold hydrolase n=1 Tax=Streptomyces sp. NBC_01317 TaxID=2903822 RepID=UPI002E13F9FD|nr:alpha/beta hydrolase [Streptomyces sp. NBC_01317]